MKAIVDFAPLPLSRDTPVIAKMTGQNTSWAICSERQSDATRRRSADGF